MKRNLITIAAVLAFASSAHAFLGTTNNTTNNTTHNQGGVGHGGNATASSRNDVSSTNVNANTNSVRNESTNVQGQGQVQGQQQAAVAGSSSGGNTMSTTITEARNNVSSAIAPSMNPTANCAIPVTGGIAAASLAISGGSAYESDTCVTIEQAKVADARGERDVAGEIMCGLEKYRAARKAVGKPCGADVKTAAAAPAVASVNEPTDPIIRRRLGLPPL